MSNEDIQGDEWDAYITLDTYVRDERGIAYGARALWRQSARSSRRGNVLPIWRPGEPDHRAKGHR